MLGLAGPSPDALGSGSEPVPSSPLRQQPVA